MNRRLNLAPLAVAGLLAASAAPTLAQPQAPPPAANAHAGCSVCDGQRLLNEGEYERAMRIFQHHAAEGDAGAMNDIGFMHQYGLGRPVDFATARQWYRKAAELKDGAALANLGYMYEHGQGGPADYAEAARLYRTGAEAGYGDAAYRLAMMYQQGLGRAVDPTAAMCWYQVAQDNGERDARPQIEKIMAEGHPYPIPPLCRPITAPVR